VEGGIVLDLREMDALALNKETMTVKVGGGTNAGNLVRFLHEHGLLAAIGECSAVGVTNWAACGGYGFLNGKVGLGVDQIVGAIVVDARGVVRDTRGIGEEGRELLWGIRGAGGNFGVLVEVELKVHKIEKMLGGWLAFKFEEARGVMQRYKALVERAKEGSLDPWGGAWGIFNMDIGKVLLYMATWADEDVAKGKEFMDQLRALGTPALDTVQESELVSFTILSLLLFVKDARLKRCSTHSYI
jgi:FAD/FMN-containing dehydrogenase